VLTSHPEEEKNKKPMRKLKKRLELSNHAVAGPESKTIRKSKIEGRKKTTGSGRGQKLLALSWVPQKKVREQKTDGKKN